MMSEPLRKTYRPWGPQRYRQEAQSPDAKLPEGDVVVFLLDLVPQLDLRRFYAPYEDETRGAPPLHPAMMVCLWLYAYCVGVFSSRKMAQACERNLAFVAMVGAERPDFRTLSDVRKLPLETCKDVFGQVLRVAGEAGLVQLGHVATDGTNRQGSASRHKAMSYGSMRKEAARLREDSDALVTQAHQQDAEDDAALGSRRGDALPAALTCRGRPLGHDRGGDATSGSAGESRRGGRAPAASRGGSGTPTAGETASWARAQTGGGAPRRQSADHFH
jgi:transposase